ncbi:hypothetical protein [Aequorivita antarctica]|uniref:Uncharacterized protein n=1 Tax=Aequorivita antarctica TaxID=153266 RepID=A0A5C6YZ59_9FLAO|nr:hypothetical protein [Aequorivita antarctica]TXD73045.1 hypothetical protein ESU54_10350 [Aequorivita antarctica]SRX74548.1 hypothetical protein AEQU3_01527 [Aequorivita antarctica]
MKKLFLTICLLFAVVIGTAQNSDSNIALGTYIPYEMAEVPAAARQILETKLGQMVTKNGISDISYNSRFIITPNVSVMSKDVIGSAPPKIVLNLDITLYIGDGVNGTLYTSKSFNVKGVGSNETKAYIAAIKNMRTNGEDVQMFVTEGKQKIIDFFNNNCELIQKEANTLANQNRFEEALGLLVNVPVNSTCYDKVGKSLKTMYQKTIDRDCQLKLAEATAIWNANQDLDAANEAGAILASIEPSSSCYPNVKSLFSKIESRVKTLSDRPWEYKLKVLDANIAIAKGAQQVLMAYAKNQPSTVMYNIHGWY